MTTLPIPPMNIFVIKTSLMHGREVCVNMIESIKKFHEDYPMEANLNYIRQMEDFIGRADTAMEAIDPSYTAPTDFNRSIRGELGKESTEMLNNFRANLDNGDNTDEHSSEQADETQSVEPKKSKESEKTT